ncbi:LysR family transcriptional regulator [Klebsiella pneumoniae]|uniref:LysR substrate-binding domain-containing protein n=1 Tax=Klebsiella pneumoniae TaxID=573 RepID=UPI001BA6FBAB|nr:LysR substrate-binding domain-containing protein [Klebsiella pneumoniae]MBQ5265164.1 LysR family transcriptional regulator [Klebsiella pneumoniae]
MTHLKTPPLSHLRAFEAAGRTGAFTIAAKELGLSPSAISHAIRKLEEYLNTRLFTRTTREIVLTQDGKILLDFIQRGLDEMQRGLDILTTTELKPLRIHTAPSFAHQWLLPRLGSFIAAHPEIDLRLSASTDYAHFEYDEYDLDIVYGEPKLSPYEKIPLAVEELTPLCSPKLAESIKKPQDLYQHMLIQCDVQLYQWKGWFEANNLPPPEHYGLRFDRSFMAIAAAVDGLGVVLESKLLAEKELSRGALVCPLVSTTQEIHYIGHYLLLPGHPYLHDGVELFKNWLLDQLNQAQFR